MSCLGVLFCSILLPSSFGAAIRVGLGGALLVCGRYVGGKEKGRTRRGPSHWNESSTPVLVSQGVAHSTVVRGRAFSGVSQGLG